MDAKGIQFVDKELRGIRLDGFEYKGLRKPSTCIFWFEHVVDDDFSYCIVLNGSENKVVEIQAEIDYRQQDERIDVLNDESKSWVEAIQYLKRNSHLLVKQVEDYFGKHSKEMEKAAKIKRITNCLVTGNWGD